MLRGQEDGICWAIIAVAFACFCLAVRAATISLGWAPWIVGHWYLGFVLFFAAVIIGVQFCSDTYNDRTKNAATAVAAITGTAGTSLLCMALMVR